jgi:predicted glycoside hydrolase/deacetylase ChbG (UPF0249 family)
MKRLLVNADGFGFTFGNNRGILEVLQHGFVRSVSVNVTWPALQDVTTLARDFPQVTLGVHLNLSVGPSILPPADIPSLVNAQGEFHGRDFRRRALRRMLNHDEMCRELSAQIDKLRQTGVTINHWDSHQGRHLYPGFFEAALEVTQQAGLRVSRAYRYHMILPPGPRWFRAASYFARHPREIVSHRVAAMKTAALRRAGMLLTDCRLQFVDMPDYAPESWQRLLQQCPEGVSFVVCHPAYVDDQLRQYSQWTDKRERERELLSDPRWCERAAAAGIEVINHSAEALTVPAADRAVNDHG